jgi:hypothetical protein
MAVVENQLVKMAAAERTTVALGTGMVVLVVTRPTARIKFCDRVAARKLASFYRADLANLISSESVIRKMLTGFTASR